MMKKVIAIVNLFILISVFNTANARHYEQNDYVTTKSISKIYQSDYSKHDQRSRPISADAYYCYIEQYPRSASKILLNIFKFRPSDTQTHLKIKLHHSDCFTNLRKDITEWYNNNGQTVPQYRLNVLKQSTFKFDYIRYIASCMYEKDKVYFDSQLRKIKNKEKSISKYLRKKDSFDSRFYEIGVACSKDFKIIADKFPSFRRSLTRQLLIRRHLSNA